MKAGWGVNSVKAALKLDYWKGRDDPILKTEKSHHQTANNNKPDILFPSKSTFFLFFKKENFNKRWSKTLSLFNSAEKIFKIFYFSFY